MLDLQKITDQFLAQNAKFVQAGTRLLSACERGVMFPFDEFMVVMLNRASWQLYGLLALLEQKNYIASASLVRLQLDNALRFNGVLRHSDPHAIAREVRQGKALRDIAGDDGKKMSDAHLQTLLDPRFKEIYKKASGFIHFSEYHFDHFFQMADHRENAPSKFYIGPPKDYVPAEMFVDLSAVFLEIGELALKLAEEWIDGRAAHGTTVELARRFPHPALEG